MFFIYRKLFVGGLSGFDNVERVKGKQFNLRIPLDVLQFFF